tara:strand:- start:262 stop:408 length:147 start_codon:yes stop_codon:yes gene_type:complete
MEEVFVVYVNGEEKGHYSLLDAVKIGEWHRKHASEKTVEIVETETSDY